MSQSAGLTSGDLAGVRNGSESIRGAAKRLGVSPATVLRHLGRVRKAEEFQGAAAVQPPRRTESAFSWSLELIRCARDDQLRGHFQWPVRLAEAMRTDDALFTAYHNRIAPHSAIAARLEAAPGVRGEAVRRRASESVIAPRAVLEGILGTMANHGLAVGYVKRHPNDDGTRVDFELCEWPLEHVQWNSSTEQLETRVRGGGAMVPIVHGDGAWIVFRKFALDPWKQEACVLPGALLWAAHANGLRDWAGGSASHGLAKIIGELPEGVSLKDADGNLSPEAESFLQMLQDVVSGEAPAGVRPPGSKTEFVSNSSTAWQVFNELILNREKGAARIYLGTDASLGSVGGAPGVDIATLFGVATTKVQGDFEALEQALAVGLYQPWAAVNEGDSRHAPTLVYDMPDPDAEAEADARAKGITRLCEAVQQLRDQQFEVTQDVVRVLAEQFGVDPAPQLASTEAARIPLDLAPTDVARVVRVKEARQSRGLPLLGDERDDMMISELEAAAEADRNAATAEAEAQAEAAPTPAPTP